MKVLYVTSLFPDSKNKTNGIFNLKRAEALQASGVEVKVLKLVPVLNRNFQVKRMTRYKINGIEVEICHYLNFPAPMTYFIKRKILRMIKQESPDIVHFHYLSDAYVLPELKKKADVPCIITAHGNDIHTTPWKSKRAKKQTLNTLHAADHIIFVSRYLKDAASELGFSSANTSVIPNGIDLSKFNIQNGSPKKQSQTVGFIGNLEPIKGSDRIPKIVRACHAKNPKTKFMIVGDGPLKTQIINKIQDYGCGQLLTHMPRVDPDLVPKIMHQLGVLVMPSRNEGYGCVAVEARACGIPVVGTQVGGIPEAIGDGGKTVSVGVNLEERMAEAVCELLESQPKPEQIRQGVLASDWKNLIGEEIRVYESFVTKTGINSQSQPQKV